MADVNREVRVHDMGQFTVQVVNAGEVDEVVVIAFDHVEFGSKSRHDKEVRTDVVMNRRAAKDLLSDLRGVLDD